MSTGAAALLPALLTLLAFVGGVLVGYLWWGRRWVSARLTKAEALSLLEGHLEDDLRARDAEIARLRQQLPGGGA